MPRKRGRRALLRDLSRLDVSGRSANPLARGSAATKEKRKEENPDTKRAGNEETGLFDIVNRKRRGWCIGQRLERHRVNGNALGIPPEGAPRRVFAPIASNRRSRYIGSDVAIARAGEPCARNCRISSTRSSSRSGC